MTCDELSDRVDAYALGALDPEEVQAVEAHLAGCGRCAAEAAEAVRTAAALALATPLRAPGPALRDRILSQARRDLAPGRGRWSLRGGWPRWAAGAAAAVAVLALLGLAVWSVSLQRDLDRLEEENASLRAGVSREAVAAAVVSDDGRVQWDMDGAGAAVGARAVLAWDPEDGLCALEVEGLSPLPAGRVYQLWLIKEDGSAVGMGTFTVDEQGTGRMVATLGGEFRHFVAAEVSIEPDGGSDRSSGPTVLRAAFEPSGGPNPAAGWP